MQQRKGIAGRKPFQKKGLGAKPIKKVKEGSDEQPIDLSNIEGYKERTSPKVVSPKKPKMLLQKPSRKTYKVVGPICSGILNETIDAGQVVLMKGQCVMVYETAEPNIVNITSADGRSAFAPDKCYNKMSFTSV